MYKIIGSYLGGSYEQIDSAFLLKDAKYLVEEYKLSYGKSWKITFYKKD